MPGPVSWLLAFPGAPKGEVSQATQLTAGSVSVGAWSTVCRQVLLTAEGIAKTVFTPTLGELTVDPTELTAAAEPVPVPAEMSEKGGMAMPKGAVPPAKIEEIHIEELD